MNPLKALTRFVIRDRALFIPNPAHAVPAWNWDAVFAEVTAWGGYRGYYAMWCKEVGLNRDEMAQIAAQHSADTWLNWFRQNAAAWDAADGKNKNYADLKGACGAIAALALISEGATADV